VSYLGQSIQNYPNGIISRLSSWQTHDKIHGNFYPLPLRHMQWLQQSSRSLMLGFNSLTGVTESNILGNIPLHTIPPISGLEIMVHCIPSWMNGISGLMSLMKYLILQLSDIRHTYPSFIQQHSLTVFCETRLLLLLHITLNLLDLLILPLTLPYLLKHTRT
jgi:hypothetical protein